LLAVPVCLPQELYDEKVIDSMSIRDELWRQMDSYLDDLRPTTSLDSAESYAQGVELLRARFAAGVGYPLFRSRSSAEARLEEVGEDATATYYRCRTEVDSGLDAYGLYIVPKRPPGPKPLVIALHGGGGSPELATFEGGGNYKDMVRGAVKHGYVVYAPHMLQYPYRDRNHGSKIPPDVAQQLELKLGLRGATLFSLEAARITAAMDALLSRSEVDGNRIAAVGLSRGGAMSVYLASLEPRIRAVVASGIGSFDTPQLICPRPIQVQLGAGDDIIGERRMGRVKLTCEKIRGLYEQLGAAERFELKVFDGRHEFHGELAWEFLGKHL
jgi:dienelactone hydrolase